MENCRGASLSGCWWKWALPLVVAVVAAARVAAQESPRVSAPEARPSRGFLREPTSVHLSSRTTGAAIYYTLDGSFPGKRNGIRYSGAIRVEGSTSKAVTTLRAAAYKDGQSSSESVTWTYVFAARVSSQPSRPAGFPQEWRGAPQADYGMDSQVAGSSEYKSRLESGLLVLPAVSLVADVDDLFGEDGIYANPTEHGDAWERAASAELLFPDGRKGFQVNCGLRISGGGSRDPEKSPKHSFRLVFRQEYGPKRLEYPLYEGSAVQRFDNLILRHESSGSWTHHHFYHREKAQYIRDRFTRESQLAMGGVSARGLFVHCYLNGLYWGLYDLTERPNAAFLADHFGGGKDDYDALNGGEVIDGDGAAWEKAHSLAEAGLSSRPAYEAFQSHVDVTGLADYMLLNFYAGTADWSHHNWYVGRKREKGAQFKFFVWDAERAVEELDADLTGANDRGAPSRLFARLRENAEFRLQFADRVQLHCHGDGALTARNAERRWAALSDQVAAAVVAESARWGDYRRDVHPWEQGPYELYTLKAHWQAESQKLLRGFFPQRTAVLLKQLRAAGLLPRVDAPQAEPVGDPEAPRSVRLAAPASSTAAIYFTTDGSDPRVYGTGELAASARRYEGPISLTGPSLIRARARRDGAWSAMLHQAYRAVSAPPDVVVTEVHYNPSGGKDEEFVELHNPGPAGVDLGGLAFIEGIEIKLPARTVLAAGGYLIVAANAEAFRERHPRVPVAGVFSGSLDNAGERLTLADETGATVVSFAYDNNDFWPLGPDGFGFSLVLTTADADPDLPSSWRASSAANGSPGAADPAPRHGGVVINEVLANPAGARFEDAVELFNPTGASIDAGGWWLSDDRDSASALKKFRLPAGTVIAPRGFAVLYAADFNARPGDASSFTLDGTGDAIYLAAAGADGRLTGYITGHNLDATEPGVPLGRAATSTGAVFTALAAPTFGVDEPQSLAEFRSGAGAENAAPRVGAVVINEIHYHALEGGEEFLELHNHSREDIDLYDAAGRLGWRVSGIRRAAGDDDFEFGAGARIPARGYLVVAAIEPEEFRRRRGVPAGVPVMGPFAGALDDSGEAIALTRPAPAPNPRRAHIVVDRVRYNDKAPWPTLADGSGPSLERLDAGSHGNEAANWGASTTVGGTPGAGNSVAQAARNLPPQAAFSFDPAGGEAPLLVHLDGSPSSDPDGEVVSLAWDFGDGDGATGAFATHTYTTPGTYAATLTVTDDQGATSSRTVSIVVAAPPAVPPSDPPDREFGSAAASFVALRDILTRFPRAVLPPPPGKKRKVDLAGSAWLVSGAARHKLKGARTTRIDTQMVLAFGPIRLADDAAALELDVPAGQFVLVDAEDRGMSGAYSVSSAGKLSLGLAGGVISGYASRFVVAHPPAVPLAIADLDVTRLSITGKGKVSKKGDTFKLKWKARLLVEGSVNGKPGPASGTLSFSGAGTPLR